jgi:hypothetical protein
VSPFIDPDFGFTNPIALGRSYYGSGDPGKLLAIVSKIKTGDFESAWQAYHEAGVELRKLAESAAAKRHNVSAREAYLWAAGYFSSALWNRGCRADAPWLAGVCLLLVGRCRVIRPTH